MYNIKSFVLQKEQAISVPCASVSKRLLLQNVFYENEFNSHENEPVSRPHFHMNDAHERLALTQRQKARKSHDVFISLLFIFHYRTKNKIYHFYLFTTLTMTSKVLIQPT